MEITLPCSDCIVLPKCYNRFVFSKYNENFVRCHRTIQDKKDTMAFNQEPDKRKEIIEYKGYTSRLILMKIFYFQFNSCNFYYSFEMYVSCYRLLELYSYDKNDYVICKDNAAGYYRNIKLTDEILNFYINMFNNNSQSPILELKDLVNEK